MPLQIVKPYAAPHHEIECYAWEPALTPKEAAHLKLILELRRGRSVQLRPLVGETDQQSENV